MYKEFEDFYNSKASRRPWDFEWNPEGFGPEQPGDSDIAHHLPILEEYARKVKTVVEFGVRDCNASSAFVRGGATVTGYDLCITDDARYLQSLSDAGKTPGKFTIINGNTLTVNIEPIDFLFIDSLHTYSQVQGELANAGHKVNKYIGFHDTFSQRDRSLDIGGVEGIWRAIEEFTKDGWKQVYHTNKNHGLTIFERKHD